MALGLLLMFFLLSVFSYVRIFFFVSLLIALNVVGSVYRRYLQLPISLEFATFGTVLAAAAYGHTAGLAVALLSPLIAAIYNGDFSPYTLVTVCIWATAAMVVPLHPANILLVGMSVAIIKNLIVTLVFQFVFQYDLPRNIIYVITDLCLNIVMFARAAPMLLPLMG